MNTNDPVQFWNQINRLGPQKKSEIPMSVMREDGSVSDEFDIVMDTWKSDFSNLYNPVIECAPNPENDFLLYINSERARLESLINTEDVENPLCNGAFSNEELDIVCNKLKNAKAVGPDLIPNEVLKQAGMRDIILNFINKCFNCQLIPSAWQKSVISPIPKSASKDPCVPLNYRGISLMSCFYKIYSGLINNRITSHCENNSLIVDEQNGFRADRSCLDHIFCISSLIRNNIIEKSSVFTAFIDMRKAFDWINRDMLLYKILFQFGISGKLYGAIKSLYSFSEACIKINNYKTDYFPLTCGVKQGDNLSPTLFSMFLNDLATGIKELNLGVDVDGCNVSILLYADDIVLIAPNENNLQFMLDYVKDWCKKWRMSVNRDKTQVVHFRPVRTQPTAVQFWFDGETLDTVNSYKYLGIYLDEHLSFKATVNALSASAGRALGFLRYKLRFLKECRCATFTKLYSSCVCPIMDYASGVWGVKSFDCLEQVQYRALRYFLGVHKFTPIDVLTGDSGWLSCFSRHKLALLRLWNRLVTLPDTRLTNKIFLWDLSFKDKAGSWSNALNKLLSETEIEYNFENLLPYNLDQMYYILKSIERDAWNSRRYSKPKLRYYNMYKSDFEQEEYLDLSIPKYHRSLFAQFRAGILPLAVEVGRYRGTPLTDRVCVLCSTDSVEDEFHVLCVCNKYDDFRKELFDKIATDFSEFEHLPDLEKFVHLLNNNQKEVITFLVKSMTRRRQLLYIR